MKNPRIALAGGLAVAVILQSCSGWIDPYTTQVILFAAINVILAVSLNLVMGETGFPSATPPSWPWGPIPRRS